MLLWASWVKLSLQTPFVLQLTRAPRLWVIQCLHGRGSRECGDRHREWAPWARGQPGVGLNPQSGHLSTRAQLGTDPQVGAGEQSPVTRVLPCDPTSRPPRVSSPGEQPARPPAQVVVFRLLCRRKCLRQPPPQRLAPTERVFTLKENSALQGGGGGFWRAQRLREGGQRSLQNRLCIFICS